MDNEVSVQDLISLSYEQKPIDFEKAFGSLVGDRLASAIETKKSEIAQTMFGGADPETETDSDAEPEDLEFDETEETPEEPNDGETA